MRYFRLVTVIVATLVSLVQADLNLRDPTSIALSSTRCTAPNRATGVTKDIEIKYFEVNPKAERTLLLVHGWPALWHIWRLQIEVLKDDYHIIAVNQRGFGGSEHPGDLKTSSTMADLVGDLACVLADAKVEKALCIGHDWGAQVCNEAARQRPDIFDGVIGTAIPYVPYSGPHVPVSSLVHMLPKLAYNVFFQHNTTNAIQELNRDVRRTLRGTLRTVDSPPPDEFLKQTDSFLRGWDAVEEIPSIPFFTAEEEEYWVDQFSTYGFNYTLGFYTSGHASWTFAQTQGNHTIPQPALSILPTNDPVANWVEAARIMKSESHFLHLTTKTVEAAHWLNIEKADEVNAIMREWLDEYYPPVSTEKERKTFPKDEL
ncbi:alpha/beta-hydrolase [Irpex rosettiformis]|uniref:Alpha/beta-hydrolase n=1 Tax=Irpex rosettiformis TaxID=378272 RepID=A0ACB8UFR5_9APHY|nr:alpha/beta-hydrolase [Irpex rosettiformis]